jgi:xylose dehydrogenase (NAD/NADP)
MSEASVTWGVLSTARINRRLFAAAKSSLKSEIIAVASRDPTRAEDYAGKNGVARAHASYEALLHDPEVEVVYIPLPNSMHIEWSIKALEAGKHVLCEKPLSRRPQEVEKVFAVAERCDRLLSEAFMYRHNPQTVRLAELVAEGAIGKPRLVRAAFSFTIESADDIRLISELDGGSLMDVGCYCVSGARNLLGEPESVLGDQILGPGGVDLLFSGTMRFPGDAIAAFDSSFHLPLRDELEVIGEEASLFLDDPWLCRTPEIELRADDRRERIAVERMDSYLLEMDDFSDAVRGAGRPLLGREDALGQARAIEALYRSAEEGRSVSLGDT